MPIRRVNTSLPTVQFEDPASPLTNALAQMGTTLGELYPRLQQIRYERDRDRDMRDERKHEFYLREQDRQDRSKQYQSAREDAINQRRESAQGQQQIRQQQIDQAAAERGAYIGNDPQLKAISDQSAAARAAESSAKTMYMQDQGQHLQAAQALAEQKQKQAQQTMYQKQAAEEIAPAGLGQQFYEQPQAHVDAEGNSHPIMIPGQGHNPDGTPVMIPQTKQVKRALQGYEPQDQQDRIGARVGELEGTPWTHPNAAFDAQGAAENLRAHQMYDTPPSAPAQSPVSPDMSILDKAAQHPEWKPRLDQVAPGWQSDPAARVKAFQYVQQASQAAKTAQPAQPPTQATDAPGSTLYPTQ